ncbi:MAG: amino acid transporter [Acidobacteria bacterium]|nr:MAG: amino acid transporter [Acidobacteriota bacterium]
MKAGPVGGVPGELARRLGFWDSFLLSLGIVIGSGVFLTPHSIARDLPSPGFILAVWVVGGVLSMMGVLAIAELGAMYPEAGGLYVYLREAFGPLPAFLYGWALFLIIQTGSAATLAVAFNVYAGYFIRLDAGQAKLVSVSLIAGLTFFNCLGIRQGATLNNCATFLKVGSILFMATAIFTGGAGAGNFRRPWSLPEGSSLLFGLGSAMIGALWAYEGWHMLSFTAGEIRDPQRNFPRALIASTAVLIGLYLLANIAYLYALTVPEIARYQDVAARSSQRALGAVAGSFVAAAIMVSIFGACHGTILSGPRVFYAMARDGLLFKSLAWVHPRLKTPIVAILAQGMWTSVLALAGTFQQLFSYVIFGGWIFYGLSALAVIVLRRRQPDLARPYRVPLYPWLPLIFAVMAGLLVVNSLVSSLESSLYAFAFLALGIPVYWIRRRLG